ncbi:double zinc ribbon domain protein [Burkholderia pseudomultivorans]|uniref:Double zinc ribbon domain protein n=1 Tax=Burkholderia pseudomultivorans TaxID=1207504 RepID=A0A6P2QNF0_9BURK|nr:zinc ribbon domain-containing protein [Burkholderia pseudomultivorans]VWC21534.1 double zinc ribbon domain protein [Burkholderia pseudomultivorans]
MGFLKRILGGDHRSGGHGGGHGGGHDGGHHGSRRGHDARDRDRHSWGQQAPAGGIEANAPLRQLACAGCGALNAADARFCAQCGAAQRGNACSRCHSALAADARFCPSCGTQAG